ncbi:hypothetical protein HMPREF9466_00173 [Fusobacterium necrophorum subsp. funduliforme 1_1_36S]|nr:hypothetical protein HMPREF9466_00173 [Fusobacterium necrophorum subsp. funduliforme 1_1_36S]
MRLLIADDEPLIRRGIQKLVNLSEIGIEEVYEAENGEEAFRLFEEYRPEIVLLDINMARLDGLSVAKKIKSLVPETKIAMITGYNYFDYAQKAIRIGVEDYILKPVSKQEISEIITKLVHSHQEKRRKKYCNRSFRRRQSLFRITVKGIIIAVFRSIWKNVIWIVNLLWGYWQKNWNSVQAI